LVRWSFKEDDLMQEADVRSEKQKMLTGELYRAVKPELRG
jgi:hypothetical protein